MMTTFERSSSPGDAGLGLFRRRLSRPPGAEVIQVDQQNIRVDLGGDGEGQTHVHATGIVLQGAVGERLPSR